MKTPSWGPPTAGLLLLALAFGLRRRPGAAGSLPLLLLVATAGFARHHLSYHLDPPQLALVGGDGTARVSAVGVIRSPVHRITRRSSFGGRRRLTHFDIDLDRLEGPGYRGRGGVRLRVYVGDEVGGIWFGDRVGLRGLLREPRAPTNPGERDPAGSLRPRRIAGVLSVGARSDVTLLETGCAPAHLQLLHRVRASAIAEIDRRLSPESAAILSCVLLGDREGISDEMRRAFERSGTLHLLAISGLHVGLIVSFIWLLLGLLTVPRRTATVMILVFLAGYATLTGLRPSVVRASVMIAVYLGAEVVGRRPDPLHSLAASAIVIALLFPMEIHSAGFQLSYLAVLSILLLRAPIASVLPRRPEGAAAIPGIGLRDRIRRACGRVVREMTAISIAAWLGTAPLVLHLFHIVTPVVVISNLAVYPIVWLLLVSGFLLVLVGSTVSPAAVLLAPVAEVSASLLLWIVRAIARLPGSHLHLPSSPLLVIAAYALLVAICLRHRLPRFLTVARLCCAGLLLISVGAAWPLVGGKGEVRVTFLDAGTGSPGIVRLPGGGTILYDCGSDRGGAAGRSIIAPALWAEGATRIDALLLSHSHSDPLSGVSTVIETFPVGTIVVPPGFLGSDNGRWIRRLAEARSIPIQVAARGDRIVGLGEGVEVEVLGPPRDPPGRLSPNEGSLVVRVRVLGRAILLAGEIERAGTRLLLAGDPDLRAEVLRFPDQGGSSRLGGALARAVSPEIAIFGSPEESVDPDLRRVLREGGARLVSTADSGATLIEIRGHDMKTTSNHR